MSGNQTAMNQYGGIKHVNSKRAQQQKLISRFQLHSLNLLCPIKPWMIFIFGQNFSVGYFQEIIQKYANIKFIICQYFFWVVGPRKLILKISDVSLFYYIIRSPERYKLYAIYEYFVPVIYQTTYINLNIEKPINIGIFTTTQK